MRDDGVDRSVDGETGGTIAADDLGALAADDPQIADFVASIPVSRMWVCNLAEAEPITRDRLCTEAFGGHCVVNDTELASLNTTLRSRGAVDRIIEAAHDGDVHMLHVRGAPIGDPVTRRALVAVRDVTTERRLEEALQQSATVLRELNGRTVSTEEALHLALADPLTGLPNRRAFDAALESACATGGFALCLCDMDRFKAVNDSLGHTVGDKLLKAVARRLRQHVRGEDFVARLAGDEFAVILKKVSTEEAAREAASRILGAFDGRLDLGELDLHASLTAGVAVATPGDDPGTVFRKADLALHTAKLRERGSLVVHAYDAQSFAAHENLVAVKALLSGRLVTLCLDPVVGASGETVAHALRFGSGCGASLDQLFETAATFGLAGDFASALLAQAFGAIAEAGVDRPVHLRLPPAAIAAPDLAGRVLARLAGARLPTTAIAFAVPLAALAEPGGEALVERLRSGGVPLVLDGWDMGFAAFSRVLSGAFTAVTLDGRTMETLIRDLRTAEVCRRAVQSLAALSVTVMARDVDRDCLARALFAAGVDAVEGPAFAARRLDLHERLTAA